MFGLLVSTKCFNFDFLRKLNEAKNVLGNEIRSVVIYHNKFHSIHFTGSPTVGVTQLVRPLKSLSLIKLGIIFAGFSFIFLMFGGRTNVALGGLFGEIIAYLTADWQNIHEIFNKGKISSVFHTFFL